MLVSLIFRWVPFARKGKGGMHYEKEVTSQVLRGQRNERGTLAQVPAQSTGQLLSITTAVQGPTTARISGSA